MWAHSLRAAALLADRCGHIRCALLRCWLKLRVKSLLRCSLITVDTFAAHCCSAG
jgi:hypothetical protein